MKRKFKMISRFIETHGNASLLFYNSLPRWSSGEGWVRWVVDVIDYDDVFFVKNRLILQKY